MPRHPYPRALALLAACATLAGILTACGATTHKPGSSSAGGCTAGQPVTHPDPKPAKVSVSLDSQAAAKVPAALKAKGTLTVAEDPSYAPNEFTSGNSNQPIGMDIDLAKALGQSLGLKVKFANSSFDGIIAGIQAGRYDLGMSSFTDTKDREKVVDFVTYFKAGTSIMVPKCNPKNINSDLDLCGKTVGAENGTIQIDQLTKKDADGSIVAKCLKAGKKAPSGKGYPQQTDASSALQAKRIDAYIADSPVVDYALKKTTGAFQKAGSDLGVAPYGIAVPRTAGTLKYALQAALQKLMADGTYKKILGNWGVASGAIDQSKINDAQG
ncbi:MAG: ABC transporter substrate-binding protein [Sciscionella sp.]